MEPQVSAWSLSILSMIMVFVVLGGLALMMNLMKLFSVQKENTDEVITPAPDRVPSVTENINPSVAPEVVVAITAALAAYLDQGPGQLFVSAINRIPSGDSWAVAGRFENMSSSSLLRRSF